MITMQVRVAVLFIAAACGPATASRRQKTVPNKPSVAVLLARLHSQDDVERYTAS